MTTSIDILFVHANFPGQYKLLASHLVRSPGFRVFAIGSGTAVDQEGVTLQRYTLLPGDLHSVHAYARRFELECRRAEQVTYAANVLKLSGMSPKIVFVHPGWGEALPLRQLFPEAYICVYCEFYYRSKGADVGFDPEFSQFGIDGLTRLHLKNAATLLSLAEADIAVAPTAWQRSLFPVEFIPKIRVIHDGIDIDGLRPQPSTFTHPTLPRPLKAGDEVLTFVARNLEPYRGFHVFMRALPSILKSRPNAQVCVVGGSEVSYGTPPAEGDNWKSVLMEEIRGRADLSRVHFLGSLAYDQFVSLLKVSRVHTYLTYPFVLSWSLLEALALGCVVVASDTAPVSEVIKDGDNGFLVPFFEPETLATRVSAILAEPQRFSDIGKRARATATNHYAFGSHSLPQYQKIIDEALAKGVIRPRATAGAVESEMMKSSQTKSSKTDSIVEHLLASVQAANGGLRKY